MKLYRRENYLKKIRGLIFLLTLVSILLLSACKNGEEINNKIGNNQNISENKYNQDVPENIQKGNEHSVNYELERQIAELSKYYGGYDYIKNFNEEDSVLDYNGYNKLFLTGYEGNVNQIKMITFDFVNEIETIALLNDNGEVYYACESSNNNLSDSYLLGNRFVTIQLKKLLLDEKVSRIEHIEDSEFLNGVILLVTESNKTMILYGDTIENVSLGDVLNYRDIFHNIVGTNNYGLYWQTDLSKTKNVDEKHNIKVCFGEHDEFFIFNDEKPNVNIPDGYYAILPENSKISMELNSGRIFLIDYYIDGETKYLKGDILGDGVEVILVR